MDRVVNIIGVASAVGSLIFVGLELRKSHPIALAGQIQARTLQSLAMRLTYLEGQWEFFGGFRSAHCLKLL